MLALLDDVLGEVVVHAGHTGSGARDPASSNAACIKGTLARARQCVRNNISGVELRHIVMVHDRVVRVTELRFGQADLETQDLAVAQRASA